MPQPARHHLQLSTVCIDCADAHELAAFYSRLLGWEVTMREPDWVLLSHPEGGTGLSFQAEDGYRSPVWPETAADQQKMLHLDIEVADLDAAVAHAVAAGARVAAPQPQEGVRCCSTPPVTRSACS